MEEEKKCKFFKKDFLVPCIVALVIGLILGTIIMYFVNGGMPVIKVKGKMISKNNLYKKMRNYYSINMALEDIDSAILNKKYNLEDDELKEIKETADYYLDMYEGYGYTEEQFLSENGFDNYDDFVNYLKVDYLRTVYYYESMEDQLEKDAIKNYYDENSFGKVNTNHILVKTSDEVSDEDALKIANEIISRLDAGEKFDDLKKEYTEKYDYVITEELGEKGAFDSLDEGYIEGMKKLNKDEYSKEPVKTSYGYHVIYCIDKAEKTEKITRKEKMSIMNIIASDMVSGDTNSYNRALIKMREDAHLKINDKVLKEKYEEYCLEYVENDDNVEDEDVQAYEEE